MFMPYCHNCNFEIKIILYYLFPTIGRSHLCCIEQFAKKNVQEKDCKKSAIRYVEENCQRYFHLPRHKYVVLKDKGEVN